MVKRDWWLVGSSVHFLLDFNLLSIVICCTPTIKAEICEMRGTIVFLAASFHFLLFTHASLRIICLGLEILRKLATHR